MTKKRKHTSIPRHKRMTRPHRLDAARVWLAKYEGKSSVKGYSKHFGVDLLCALKELEILGVNFSEQYVTQLKKSIEGHVKANQERKRRRKEQEEVGPYPDSDYYFAFIAGYTESGFAYGTTWEEEEAAGMKTPVPGLEEQGDLGESLPW